VAIVNDSGPGVATAAVLADTNWVSCTGTAKAGELDAVAAACAKPVMQHRESAARLIAGMTIIEISLTLKYFV
jgi:hypothetical protein